MLSTGAFNALLKTLEEPPEHVIFILATTEPHKLPATILSRCQRFDFRRISQDSIAKHLDRIASANGIKLDPNAAKLMARMSDGAMRDAVSLLDQCMSHGKKSISYDDVLSTVGVVNDEFMVNFVDCILAKNIKSILQNVRMLIAEGRDAAHFTSDLVVYFRNLLVCRSTNGNCDDLTDVPTEILKTVKLQAQRISLEEIMCHIRELSALEYNLKYAANPRVLLEVTLIKLCRGIVSPGTDIEERLAAIERKLESGDFLRGLAAGPPHLPGAVPSGTAGMTELAGQFVSSTGAEDKGTADNTTDAAADTNSSAANGVAEAATDINSGAADGAADAGTNVAETGDIASFNPDSETAVFPDFDGIAGSEDSADVTGSDRPDRGGKSLSYEPVTDSKPFPGGPGADDIPFPDRSGSDDSPFSDKSNADDSPFPDESYADGSSFPDESYADGSSFPGESIKAAKERAEGRTSPGDKESERKASSKKAADYEKWPEITEHLKSIGKLSIYLLLLNARAVLLDDETIGVVAKEDNLRSMISKVEHIRIIEDAAFKVTGHRMKIRCINDEILQKAVSDEKPESSDLLRRARMLADKVGLPLEIIDE
jgi:hypothetical protein